MVLPSFINLVLCTNEAVPVRMEGDDRRWAVYQVNPAHANDQVDIGGCGVDARDSFAKRPRTLHRIILPSCTTW